MEAIGRLIAELSKSDTERKLGLGLFGDIKRQREITPKQRAVILDKYHKNRTHKITLEFYRGRLAEFNWDGGITRIPEWFMQVLARYGTSDRRLQILFKRGFYWFTREARKIHQEASFYDYGIQPIYIPGSTGVLSSDMDGFFGYKSLPRFIPYSNGGRIYCGHETRN